MPETCREKKLIRGGSHIDFHTQCVVMTLAGRGRGRGYHQ